MKEKLFYIGIWQEVYFVVTTHHSPRNDFILVFEINTLNDTPYCKPIFYNTRRKGPSEYKLNHKEEQKLIIRIADDINTGSLILFPIGRLFTHNTPLDFADISGEIANIFMSEGKRDKKAPNYAVIFDMFNKWEAERKLNKPVKKFNRFGMPIAPRKPTEWKYI